MLGKIVFNDEQIEMSDPNKRNLVAEVSIKEPRYYGEGNKTIIAFDCGMKYNQIRSFVSRGVKLKVVPYNYDLTK
jgi:carbamoylphosphate synthase small subunit